MGHIVKTCLPPDYFGLVLYKDIHNGYIILKSIQLFDKGLY